MYPISVVKNELIYLSIAAIQRYEKRSCPLEMKELGERERVLFFFFPIKGVVRDDGLSGEDPGMIMRTLFPFFYWIEDYAVGKLKKTQ